MRQSLAVAVLTLFLLACDGGITGTALAGRTGRFEATYVLRTVNGQPLPARPHVSAYGYTEYLADTLTFRRDLTVVASGAFYYRYTDPYDEDRVDAYRWSREYRRRGLDIVIGSFTPCPPNANCVGNDVGVFRGDSLFLSHEGAPPDRAIVRAYVRVAAP